MHSYYFGPDMSRVMYTNYDYYWFTTNYYSTNQCIAFAMQLKQFTPAVLNVVPYRARGTVVNEWLTSKGLPTVNASNIYFFSQHSLNNPTRQDYHAYSNARDDSGKYVEQGSLRYQENGFYTTFQSNTDWEIALDTNMEMCETAEEIQGVYDTGEIPPRHPFKVDWKILSLGTKNIVTKTRADVSEITTPEDSPFYESENQMSYKFDAAYTQGTAESGEIIEFHAISDSTIYTYEDLVKVIDRGFWDKVFDKIASLVDGSEIDVVLHGYYNFGEDDQMISSGAWFRFNSGGITDYGTYGEDTIEIYDDEDKYDDDTKDDTDDGDDGDKSDELDDLIPNQSGASLLTTTYMLSPSVMRSIGQSLWSNSFVDSIFDINDSPISNIVSCKVFPFVMSGTSTPIKIGNVEMGQSGDKMDDGHYILSPIGGSGKYVSAKVRLSTHKHMIKYMNYGEYTRVSIFLPYVGIQQLDTNRVMGKTLRLYTAVDIITGACEYTLECPNKDGIYSPIGVYRCNIGEDVPVTASNRAQLEAGYIGTAIGTATDIAVGNYAALPQKALGAITSPFTSTTNGTPSPSVASCGYMHPFLIIDRPTPDAIDYYGSRVGWLCNTEHKLSKLSGWTVVDNPKLNSISCNETEREEIRSLLSSGVYL